MFRSDSSECWDEVLDIEIRIESWILRERLLHPILYEETEVENLIPHLIWGYHK